MDFEDIINLTTDENNSGERIDKFLSDMLSSYSRSYVQKLISDSLVLVDNKNIKSNYKLRAGDAITIYIPVPRELEVTPENLPLYIIYEDDDIIVKERNILQVRLNKDNQLMCGTDYIDVKQLKEKAKEFIANPYDDENLPEKHRKNIPLLGDCMITENHVISVQNDVGTSYQAYIDVQNELVAAYNELRNELGKAKFGKLYNECNEDEQKAIREYYPQKISEAEPKKYGGK